MNTRTALFIGAATGLGCFAWRNLRQHPRLDLTGKNVLITGGSRGLGLQLAREFGARGAAVAICARDPLELVRAKEDLVTRGIRVHTAVCDVSSRIEVSSMCDQVAAHLGPIHVLVNNAGVIEVGPADEMTFDDFENAMDVIFWGTLNTTLSVLPSMLERRAGSIVNITSIGGKVSVPHLLPYSCAKFATVALSEGLRSEFAPKGVCVTTIVPGLMRTGSHLKARFKGQHSKEYAWFGLGAASAGISIGADRAARSIVNATIRGDGEKILSLPAEILARLHGLMPGLTGALLTLLAGALPGPGSEDGQQTRTGAELEAGFNSTLWKVFTAPGYRAAQLLNQRGY